MKSLYMIMGMHRSGTSLTVQMLKEMNVWIGEENQMIVKDQYNERGYWELAELVQINDVILTKSNMMWYSLDKLSLNKEVIQKLVPKFEKKYLNNEHINMAVKDPRLTILWKEWLEGLKDRQRIVKGIVVARNPLEVAQSLSARDGMQMDYALCLWYKYNWECLLFAKEYDSIWIYYDEYFEGYEEICNRIWNFVYDNKKKDKVELKGVVDCNIRHFIQKEEIVSEVAEKALSLYESIKRLCKNEISIGEVIRKHLYEYDEICSFGAELDYPEPIQKAIKDTYLYSSVKLLKESWLSSFDNWILEHNKPLVLCGNGRNCEQILPVLEKNGVDVVGIYDKKHGAKRKYLDKEITVETYQKMKANSSEENIYLITPFYQNEEEIVSEVKDIIGNGEIHKLSDILMVKWTNI